MSGSSHNHLALISDANATRSVLCTYAHEQPQLLQFPMAVLEALTQQSLSFAVPLPTRTKAGTLWHVYEDEYRSWLMTMTPWYVGEHPAVDDVASAAIAGVVLADLLNACSHIHVDAPSPHAYGLLQRMHPYVIDPLVAMHTAPMSADVATQVIAIVQQHQQAWTDMYGGGLPQQIIHGEFVPRNVLLMDNQVVAVLDFETCRVDLRIIEIAVAVLAWGSFDDNHDATPVQAFMTALLHHIEWTDAEIAALPLAMRLVRTVRLIVAIGRYQQGVERSVVVERAAQGLLNLDAWLQQHGALMVSELTELSA